MATRTLPLLRQMDLFPDWPTPIRGTVYVMSRADGYVKIGWTGPGNLRRRRRDLRATVLLTLDGTKADERRYHEQFAGARLMGEWFAPTPALLAFLRAHALAA